MEMERIFNLDEPKTVHDHFVHFCFIPKCKESMHIKLTDKISGMGFRFNSTTQKS